jgi:hypothetical protein
MEDYVTRFGDNSLCLKNASITSLNQILTLHSGQKYTMNELANMFSVMPHIICFRVGMLMNNIHSFFDYIKGSEKWILMLGKTSVHEMMFWMVMFLVVIHLCVQISLQRQKK